MDELMDEICSRTADHSVQAHWSHLSKKAQLRRWWIVYDAVYSSLIVFDEMTAARRVRLRHYLSEN